MTVEIISEANLKSLTKLTRELWPDCSFDEEFENYKHIIGARNEVCYLFKDRDEYIAFIQVSIRNDYVEGATDLPVAYIEAVYVKIEYQRQGIARKLIRVAEEWAKQKGLFTEAFESVEQLDAYIAHFTADLIHKNPAALLQLKKIFWEGTDHWDNLLEQRAEMSGKLILSDFAKEAIAKFLQT